MCNRFSIVLVIVLTAATAVAESPKYPTHGDLSYYLSETGERVPICTPENWRQRREHIMAGMQEVMGALPRPAKPVALDVQTLEEHAEPGYIRRKIAYHTDDANKRVHAWLLVPTASDANRKVKPENANRKLPAVLCLHQTTPRGKDSPAGLSDRPTLHYARELALRGYVTLSPDYPSFGEYPYDFDADDYVSGTMKAIYDNTRAIDMLAAMPEVDADRIGCIGHSLGGHNSLFTAVFDQRLKAIVTCCGFTSFHKYMRGDLHGWSSPRYMPLIGSKYDYSPDRMPFDFPEVLAAIAPRAVFVVAPLHDDNFDIDGVRESLATAKPIFELLGHSDNLQAVHPDSKHDFRDAERQQAYEFLDRVLAGPSNQK